MTTMTALAHPEPYTPTTYFTVRDIRQANKDAGFCWFSPGSMRFFGTRVLPGVYHGKYFITSDRFDSNSPRLYSIRVITGDRRIDTVGEFQGYATAHAARQAAKAIRE